MRGVRREQRHEELVRMLADDAHPEADRSIFPTMRELLCFAAVLGFQEERLVPLAGATLEIDSRIWRGDEFAVDLLYLIPLAAKRSLDILSSEAEEVLLSTFEGYANGGLQILGEWLKETPEDPHGDRALLNALHKHGYLSAPQNVDAVVDQVTF